MVHTTNEYCFSGNNFIKLTAIRKAGTLVNTGGKKNQFSEKESTPFN
jgi:hypothetical protein